MQPLFQELRVASRQLRKTPGFTATVILTLAIGIGATTAIFSLIEGILLRPLPFRDPGRLVLMGDHIGEGAHTPVTAREIGTYSSSTSAFSSMGGYIVTTFELSDGATPEQANAARFTSGVFPTLGVEPVAGRVFTQKEEDDHLPVAVISYSLWRTRYHLAPDVVGTLIQLDRKAYTIIGVMPHSFDFPLENGRLEHTQVWVPMSFTNDELSEESAGFWGYNIVARLKDGVTTAQAAHDADRVAQQIMRNLPPSQSAIHLRGDVIPLLEYDVAEVRPLLSVTGLYALVAFSVSMRTNEIAVRMALGSERARIARLVLISAIKLALFGCLLGVLGSVAVSHIVSAFLFEVSATDPAVYIVGVLIMMSVALLATVVPAIRAALGNPLDALRSN